jgi:formate dehydrogenase maturation protein FdhE
VTQETAVEPDKACSKCGTIKPATDFYIHQGRRHPRCKACLSEYHRSRYKQTNGKDKVFEQSLKRLYGITLDDYNRMAVEQGNLCALCGDAPDTERRMHVDHDHVTGKIRALLCHHCNLLLGNAKDSPDRLRLAIAYLERHQLDNHPAYTLAAGLAERLQQEDSP